MSFPIYMYDMPWIDTRRPRGGSGANLEAAAERTSRWKRELSFGRRTSRSAPEQSIAVEAAKTEWGTDEATETEAARERTSIWKRELSFGRRKHAEAEPEAEAEEQAWWAPRPERDGGAEPESESFASEPAE